MNAFDVVGYHFVNQFAGHYPLLDKIMEFFAQYALELYAIFFILAWLSLPREEESTRHALVVSGFAGLLALLFNLVIAQVWFRPRPFAVLPQGSFTKLIFHPADASFPSDHASGSFAFAASSWGHTNRWISVPFTVLALVVLVSRVYVGVHWPTDVLAGMLVGMIAGKLMWKFSARIAPLTLFGLRLCRFGRFSPHRRRRTN